MTEWIALIGPLGIPLALISLIGLALIVERVVFYARIPSLTKSPVLETLRQQIQTHKDHPKPIRDELITFRLQQARTPYFYGVRSLRIIAVISPMLGLLGTVLGIIKAFKVIATHTGPVQPSLIADGLWSAMLTTAVGLIIALPCLLAAFIFARLGEQRIGAYENALNAESLKLEGVTLDD